MAKRTPTRPLWADRFASPTAEGLLGAINGDLGSVAAEMRQSLRSEPSLRESLRWCGLPWRWALAYADGSGAEAAYLVPNPDGPCVVFRLSHEQVTELPARKLSRYIRDGLAQARLVAGVAWPQWSLQHQSHIKDLGDLFALLREPAAAGA
jgi:hypothetical protein